MCEGAGKTCLALLIRITGAWRSLLYWETSGYYQVLVDGQLWSSLENAEGRWRLLESVVRCSGLCPSVWVLGRSLLDLEFCGQVEWSVSFCVGARKESVGSWNLWSDGMDLCSSVWVLWRMLKDTEVCNLITSIIGFSGVEEETFPCRNASCYNKGHLYTIPFAMGKKLQL